MTVDSTSLGPLHTASAVLRDPELQAELIEWCALHDIDANEVAAVQDGSPTAVRVYDRDDTGRRHIVRSPHDPRFGDGATVIASHWVVIAPRWPMP